MSPAPAVSVVIPTYDNAPYLAETIASVLAQDHPDVETIVVDDGSTDGTQDVLASFGDRIRSVRQENRGASEARNHGLRLARGEYVVFLDGDDVLLPGKLRAQTALLEARPELGYAHSGWHRIDANGARLDTVEPWHEVPDLTLEQWLVRKPVFMGAMLVRRAWVERAGGFDPTLAQAEDLKLFLDMVAMGCRGGWVYEPTVCYRQHRTSLTRNRVQMLTCSNRVVAEFFARADLSPPVRALKDEVGFGTLVWSAWQLHRSGDGVEVAAFLRQSLAYDGGESTVKVVQRWLHGLFYNALQDGCALAEVRELWPHIRAAIDVDDAAWRQLEPALDRWLKCFAVLEANY